MDERKGITSLKTEFGDALKGYHTDHDEVLDGEQDIDYRSLTAESVGSLILGFLSSLMLIHWVFAIFPILGIILGVMAIKKILNAQEELSGFGISTAGVVLCILFLVGGSFWLSYVETYTVPPGYYEITFEDLLADPKTGRIPEKILRLVEDKQRIYIEGHMFPTRKMNNIESFVLVPELEQSKFGSPTRNPMEMVEVQLQGGLSVSFRTLPVHVGGVLTVNENYAKGTDAEAKGALPYKIDADLCR